MNDVPIRLLRDALQSRVPAAPSHECLDAETMAAWADDALARDERQAAEAHAADCARCQALLAAMAAPMPRRAAVAGLRTVPGVARRGGRHDATDSGAIVVAPAGDAMARAADGGHGGA